MTFTDIEASLTGEHSLATRSVRRSARSRCLESPILWTSMSGKHRHSPMNVDRI